MLALLLTTVCLSAPPHAGAELRAVPVAKGLPTGFTWKQSGEAYGITGPDGGWYLPPNTEATDRLAAGWTYTPTPELKIPRGVWESPCIKDGGCRVVEVRMPTVGQHGLPTQVSKLDKVETPFHPNDYLGGVRLECKECAPTITTQAIPFSLTSAVKVKRVVVGGKYYDQYPNGTLVECVECNRGR